MHTHLSQVKENAGEFNIKMVMKEYFCQLKEGYQDLQRSVVNVLEAE